MTSPKKQYTRPKSRSVHGNSFAMSTQHTTRPPLTNGTPSNHVTQPGQESIDKDDDDKYNDSGTYYSPEGDKSHAYMNNQIFANTNTDTVYSQLKTHAELNLRAVLEVMDRRTEMKDSYTKKLEELKSVHETKVSKAHEIHRTEYNRLKQDSESQIKSLEIQLAERVAAQNAMERSNKEKFDSLNTQLKEKTQRIHKLECDYDELNKKFTKLQKSKQDLQHEYDTLNEQIQRMKSMMLGIGSNKKRRINNDLL